MSATRVLVTGAAGQVGRDLMDALGAVTPPGGDDRFQPDGQPVRPGEFDAVGLTRADLDVTDRAALHRALAHVRPDVVVHLAAYTAVDRAETDVERCYAVNDDAVGVLSAAVRERGAHLVTISTDYVFDGTKGFYREDDATNPLNVYGSSKLAGERRCHDEDTIVRTSWVMGVRGSSVVHVMIDKANSDSTVRFVNDQRGTVTASSDLARALVTMVRERPGGCWHVANTGATTWYDVAAYVGTLRGRDDTFATAIATSELSPAPLAARPAKSDLDTGRFAARFAALPPWREAIERLVREREARVHRA